MVAGSPRTRSSSCMEEFRGLLMGRGERGWAAEINSARISDVPGSACLFLTAVAGEPAVATATGDGEGDDGEEEPKFEASMVCWAQAVSG